MKGPTLILQAKKEFKELASKPKIYPHPKKVSLQFFDQNLGILLSIGVWGGGG